MRLTAHYEGIGPVFKIKMQLQNLDAETVTNSFVQLSFNENIYKRRDRNPMLPVMLPMMTYKVDCLVECIDATGANDIIKVIVLGKESSLPLISANL